MWKFRPCYFIDRKIRKNFLRRDDRKGSRLIRGFPPIILNIFLLRPYRRILVVVCFPWHQEKCDRTDRQEYHAKVNGTPEQLGEEFYELGSEVVHGIYLFT